MLQKPLKKLNKIKAFLAMDIMEQAQALESQGYEVISMALGEPDLPPPEIAKTALSEAAQKGQDRYTHPQGLIELRESICLNYKEKYGVQIAPEQIFITAGTSPAILLALGSLLAPGDEVLLPELHYPCYPNFLHFYSAEPKFFPIKNNKNWEIKAENIAEHINDKTRALILASPANPTGALLSRETLETIAALDLFVISDEIYQGLNYESEDHTLLEFTDDCFIFNGFSKAYAMPGYRVGYLIAPLHFCERLRLLFQNFYISTNTPAQHAALKVLEQARDYPDSIREIFKKRRDLVLNYLRDLNWEVPVKPQGAFYILAQLPEAHSNSLQFCQELLQEKHVALTPGIDFGAAGEGYVRFSYTCPEEKIHEAFTRIREFLQK